MIGSEQGDAIRAAHPGAEVQLWATDEHRIGLLPLYPLRTAHKTSAQQAALLVVQRLERRYEGETAYLTRLRAQHEPVELARRLEQEFAQMVREREGTQLDGWIEVAKASGIDAPARFAVGLLPMKRWCEPG